MEKTKIMFNGEEVDATEKVKYRVLISMVDDSDLPDEDKNTLIVFLEKKIEQLDKKRSSSKSKDENAVKALTELVLTVLSEQTEPKTVTDLLLDSRLQSYTETNGDKTITKVMSNSKLTSILIPLVKEKKVVREEVKKRPYYSLA